MPCKLNFRQFQQIANAGAYHELDALPVPLPLPEFFNWTTEIFEGLHVAAHPEKTALVLADDTSRHAISYGQLAHRANRLLNYWRTAGVGQGQAVLLMVPVCAPSSGAPTWRASMAGNSRFPPPAS